MSAELAELTSVKVSPDTSGGGKAKRAEANGGERERKRHDTAADIRRILKQTGPK